MALLCLHHSDDIVMAVRALISLEGAKCLSAFNQINIQV